MPDQEIVMNELWASHNIAEEYGTRDEFRAAIEKMDWRHWRELEATPNIEHTVISLTKILYPIPEGNIMRAAIDCKSIPDCCFIGIQVESSLGMTEHRFFLDSPKNFSSVITKTYCKKGSHAEQVVNTINQQLENERGR